MTISVRSAQVWRIFIRKNQLDSIIINWKTMSWLLRCKLIRCLVRRVHHASSPLLLTGEALGRFCFRDPQLWKLLIINGNNHLIFCRVKFKIIYVICNYAKKIYVNYSKRSNHLKWPQNSLVKWLSQFLLV